MPLPPSTLHASSRCGVRIFLATNCIWLVILTIEPHALTPLACRRGQFLSVHGWPHANAWTAPHHDPRDDWQSRHHPAIADRSLEQRTAQCRGRWFHSAVPLLKAPHKIEHRSRNDEDQQ